LVVVEKLSEKLKEDVPRLIYIGIENLDDVRKLLIEPMCCEDGRKKEAFN